MKQKDAFSSWPAICWIPIIYRRTEWDLLQDRFDYYTVGIADAQDAAELQVALRRTGWQLATVDALIATTAIRNNLILLTTDGDFRPIKQLAQENWIRAQRP